MKIIILLFVLLTNICFGQANTCNQTYDSLVNYLGDDVYKYKGQVLFLKGKHKDLHKWGYYCFFKDIKLTRHYKEQWNGRSSEYHSLACKHFKVIDVIDHTMVSFPLSRFEYILKLLIIENNEIVYFKYNPDNSNEFYFLVQGYLEKLEQIYNGKKYKLKEYVFSIKKDINTNKPMCFNKSDWWTVTGITLNKENYMPMLKVRNSKGNETEVDLVFFK